MGRPDRRTPRQQGFSLLELMVVLVLIGIMTAIILPEMRGSYQDALLRATGRTLVQVFSLAHSRAVTLRQTHRVQLDLKQGRYAVTLAQSEAGNDPLRPVAEDGGKIDPRIAIEIRHPGDDPSAAPDAEAMSLAAPDRLNPSAGDTIRFYPDGTADPAEIVLRDREGFRLALRIHPITARVRVITLERQ